MRCICVHQGWCWGTPKLRRRVECRFVIFFELEYTFCHFPRNSWGVSFLCQGFFLRSVLTIWSTVATLMRDQNAEFHLAVDPFFPKFSCGVMHHSRIARGWISAAQSPEIRSLIAWNASTKQQNLYHQSSSVACWADCQPQCA